MITTYKAKGETYLAIGTKRFIQRGRSFLVPYSLIVTEDLSTLPDDSIIGIDPQISRQTQLHDQIEVSMLRTLANTRVIVLAEYYRCSCCWNHALDYKKFTVIAAQTFSRSPKNPNQFMPDGIGVRLTNNDPVHHFSVEVDNGYFRDVERQVRERITQMMQPLLDYCDQVDKQTRQRFGV